MEDRGIIPRIVEGQPIRLRSADRYVNATDMCKASGKQWNDYWRLGSTAAFIEALSTETGIPVSGLVEARRGGDVSLQGTWAHPQVAINLAQWLSPAFAVAVTEWMFELLTVGQVALSPVPVAHPVFPRAWSERLSRSFQNHAMYINRTAPGSWTVLTEISTPMMVIEDCLICHLLPLSERDLPDGSVGKRWSMHREALGWPKVSKTAPLLLRETDKHPIQVTLYPPGEREAFSVWFYGCYVPNHMPDYLRNKFQPDHGRLPPLSAADHASQRIVGRPALLRDGDRKRIEQAGGTVRAVPRLPSPRTEE